MTDLPDRSDSASNSNAAWLRALSSILHSGVILLDGRNHVVFASDRAHHLLNVETGGDLDAAAGRLCAEIARRTGKTVDGLDDGWTIHVEHDSEDDDVMIRVRIEPIEDGDGSRLLVLTDCSAVEDLRSALRLASRFQNLLDVHAKVVHDLKAPLNVLTLHLELLKRTLATTEPAHFERAKQSMDLMKNEIKRLDRMLLEILDPIARTSGVRERRFDVARFIPRFGELVRPLCRDQSIEFVVEVPRAQLVVHGDPDRLKQALLNLVVNALDGMEPKGRLELRASDAKEHVRIDVCDSGPGIPQAQLEKLWTIHQPTTKPTGHGIGLFAVHAAVTQLRGTIRAENRSTGGCAFTIELPRAR